MGCGVTKYDGTATILVEQPRESSQLTQLRQGCLKSHNEKRAKHGAQPLTLNVDLNTMAQKWADHLAQTGVFEHNPDRNNTGENLAAHNSLSADSGETITNMWYGEIQNYNFHNPGFALDTDNFTQLVWKDTREMGVGMARNEKLRMYVFVANYTPAGNTSGAFEANVEPAPEEEE